jgi:ABC-type uncharacterized transport system permease subunit
MILSLAPPVAIMSESAMWLASGAYVLAALWPTPKAPSASAFVAATRLLPLAWVLHAFALAMALIDWAVPEPVARFGFAPALSMTLWCVVGVYMIERLHTASQKALQVLAALSVISLVLSWLFPGQAHPQIHQNWAPLHWVLGFTSYGLVGAALLHAGFWRMAEKRLRAGAGPQPSLVPGIPLLRLETLTFRFVVAAFLALSLTLLLGIWHSQPWRWDHKTVLSVMAWGVFACLLAGRVWFGWRGRTAIRWLYVGAALLLLAYAGSRFVLEVILQRPDRLG